MEYNRTMYNKSGEYIIVLFNDTYKTMISIYSKDLDTGIYGTNIQVIEKASF